MWNVGRHECALTRVGDAFICEIFQKPILIIYSKSAVWAHIGEMESADEFI